MPQANENTEKVPTRKKNEILETVRTIVEALLIALLVRTFLFQPFNIPSGSMIPTLRIGDYLFVSKYSYGYSHFSLPFAPPLWKGRILASKPHRGDVAVFITPGDGHTDYIKRIIGLPGDRIQMIGGRLYINGKIVKRTPIHEITTTDPFGRRVRVPTYMETLPNGVKHVIIQIDGDNGPLANTAVYVVPPGDYFMMGDNRDDSLDSRIPVSQGGVGYVPFQNLIGRAEVLFFSVRPGEPAWAFWAWPWTVRWNRLFHLIH